MRTIDTRVYDEISYLKKERKNNIQPDRNEYIHTHTTHICDYCGIQSNEVQNKSISNQIMKIVFITEILINISGFLRLIFFPQMVLSS